MTTTGPYSELEYLILAMVGEDISSGYAMRKEMNRMRGGRWSAESGSVYRVLRRLEQDDLVKEMRKVGVPNRERTEYALTEKGEAVLHSWLIYPPDRAEMAFLVDPIRTRSYFLSRLKPVEQAKVMKAWLLESRAFIADLEREMQTRPEGLPFGREIAYQNLLQLAQARHEWIRKSLSALKIQVQLDAAPQVAVHE